MKTECQTHLIKNFITFMDYKWSNKKFIEFIKNNFNFDLSAYNCQELNIYDTIEELIISYGVGNLPINSDRNRLYYLLLCDCYREFRYKIGRLPDMKDIINIYD